MLSLDITAARFETDLYLKRNVDAVKRDGARVEAVVMEPYRVSFTWNSARWSLMVPAGFLAAPSVPPRLHGMVPFWGALFEASIAHDWCYWTRCFDQYAGAGGRFLADQLLVALMAAGNTSRSDCAEVFLAVRAFGGDNYERCKFRPGHNLVRMAA